MLGSVRDASSDDGPAIAEIYRPYVLETAISFEETPPSAAEMSRRIAEGLVAYPFLVFEERGEVVGYAYGSPHRARAAYRWSVDVSIYIAQQAHRHGIGRKLYLELLDRLTRRGFHSAFAGIALPNDKSIGLHEAMGFRHLGTYQEVGFKFGRWHDVGWWRLSLDEGTPGDPPSPPRI